MTDQNSSSSDVVRAWEQAVNERAVDQALELSHPDVEIVGPRGVAKGTDVLRNWLSRAGLSLTTHRSFVRAGVAVSDQHGVWRDMKSGEVVGDAAVATHYKVEDGRVTYLARYDTLDEALAKAGLSTADEVLQV